MKYKSLENALSNSIIEYCFAKGHFAYRTNNMPRYDAKKEIFYRLPKHTPPGVPDIHVWLKGGGACVIEAKVKPRKQSEGQVKFQENIEATGNLYILAYSLDDVMKHF